MSTDTETNINIIAAKICGHQPFLSVVQGGAIKIGKGQTEQYFTLDNPADREAMVIALGEKHATYVFPVMGEDEIVGWRYKRHCMTSYRINKTYKEAICVAVQYIAGREDK